MRAAPPSATIRGVPGVSASVLVDLDEAVRRLLKRELKAAGLETVDVRFEAPSRDWAAKLSAPTLDVFLYDVRQSADDRPVEWTTRDEKGRRVETRPPLMADVSYAVTAWTREVEDEHRLLSCALAILYEHPVVPDDVRTGALLNGAAHIPLRTRLGAPGERSDFWSSVGGQYKASVDYVITAPCISSTETVRGPEIRELRVRARDIDGPNVDDDGPGGAGAGRSGTSIVIARPGGRVLDGKGEPVAGAWVTVEESGIVAVSSSDGRFILRGLQAGQHTVTARTADGLAGEAELTTPGGGIDVVVAAEKAKGKRGGG
jgi:hypothetical protein